MIEFKNTSLSSRRHGALERKRIIKSIESQESVIINLENVFSMSESFSDECFGVLFLIYDYAELTNKIKFINANDQVKLSIANAILRRKIEHSKESTYI